MKVLLLGGTGAIGVHLSELLSEKGMDVSVTTRSARKSGSKISFITGNGHDNEFLASVLKQRWDAIVDFMVYETGFFSARVDMLLKATTQYVFLSSARVYADPKDPIRETSPRLLEASSDQEFLATDEYSLAKARQENVLLMSGSDNWTIIRPYITYGEQRLQLGVLEKEAWLYRALRGRTIVFSKDLSSRTTTLTHGFDVARGIAALIGEPGALKDIFHITTSETTTWGETLSVYLDVLEHDLGYRPKVRMETMSSFSKCHYGEYQIRYDRLFDRKFDNQKIARYLEVDSFIPIKTGIEECLQAFLRNPKFLTPNWKTEAMKDRLTHEHTPLREIGGIKQKAKYLFNRYSFK